MREQGVIVRLLETWPLQIVVDTGRGQVHVGLRQETRVTHGGRPVAPDALRVGDRVVVEGEETAERAVDATAVAAW